MRNCALFMVIAVTVSGCQTAEDGTATSSTPAVVAGPAASVIASDMAIGVAEQIGSVDMISIQISNDVTEYATALENALRGWGYTVITDGKADDARPTIQIAYSLDNFDGQLLASVSTSSVALARTYATSPLGVAATSPLSVMRR